MSNVVVLSPEQLEELVERAVKKAIRELDEPRDPAKPPTDEELAEARKRWTILTADSREERDRLRTKDNREINRRGRYVPTRTRRRVLSRDGLVCRLCGRQVDADDVHLDHVKPLSRGGRTTTNNLQVTHSACNLRKGSGA